MNARPVLFDLDGTISDPSAGITKSINYALKSLQVEPRPADRLLRFIGPPLFQIFSELLETDDDCLIMQAVSKFRERYVDVGYKENTLYPGILNTLNQLIADGHRLYIVTSKRTDIAKKVVCYFGIDRHFNSVYGCGLKKEKAQVLSELISGIRIRDKAPCMVGDRGSDIWAAKHAEIGSIGVTWGFGSRKELEDAGADTIIDSIDSLVSAVK
jgi:phosphoglycolate phosphatase